MVKLLCKSLASLKKNWIYGWWIFVSPSRVLVKNLVNDELPPGLLQRSVYIECNQAYNGLVNQTINLSA